MRFLPIIERELRVAGRKPRTYWSRVGAVAILAVVVFWVLLASIHQAPGEIGRILFTVLGGLTAFFCAFAGLRLTADCLSAEKREGTLGLLFLTDLRGVDLAMGKLGAGTIQGLLNLLAVFPLFALPFLLGGVTLKSFGLLLVALLALLGLSLCFGLVCSVVFRDDRAAFGGAVLLMLLSVLGPILGLYLAHEFGAAGATMENWGGLSTAAPVALVLAGTTWSPSMGEAFALGLGTSVAEGLLCLLVAALVLPAVFRREAMGAGGPVRRSGAAGAPAAAETAPAPPTTPRRHLLDLNPVLWLCQRDWKTRNGAWIALGVLALLWLCGLAIWPDDWLDAGWCLFTAFLLHCVLKVLMAGAACRQFNQDRGNGALELLLCTSLSVGDVLRGQTLALIRQFRGPLLVVLAADLFLFIGFMNDVSTGSERLVTGLIWLAGVVALGVDLLAMAPLAMWLGLTHRRANAAVTKTIARIMALPWALFLVAMSLTVFMPFTFRGNLSGVAVVLFWMALTVGNAIGWFTYATSRLKRDFRREAIGQRHDGGGLFFRLFSGFRRTPPPLPGAGR